MMTRLYDWVISSVVYQPSGLHRDGCRVIGQYWYGMVDGLLGCRLVNSSEFTRET